VANSIWTFQIVLDRVLLANTGRNEVAACIAAAMVFWTILTLFQYTANYATTFVAQYTGAGRPDRVGPVVGQALWFAAASGLAFLLLWPLAPALVGLAGHEAALQELETIYLRCLSFCGLPMLVTAAACSFFTGRGDSRTVLVVNVAGLVVNGVCAWVWIYGKIGFPALGIAGAGWAAVVGTSTSAVLALNLVLRRRHREAYGNGRHWGFDRALFLRLMRFGVPNGVGAFLDGLAFTMFLALIGRLGAVELAATSVVFTLNLIAILPMFGVAQAVEVLVGQRLGEDRPDLAERSTWTGLAVVLSFTAVLVLAYVLVPQVLARPFFDPKDSVNWGDVAGLIPILLRFVAVYCLFDCLNLIFSFALRGAGDTRFVTAVALGLAWPVMVLPTWASWRFGWGLYAAWGFVTLYIIVLAATFLWRFRRGPWRTMRVIETPAGVANS
jgi:MATE family multidrug resistance protein